MSIPSNGQLSRSEAATRTGGGLQRNGSAAHLPSVGIVHDWLPVYAGAERVLEQMINVFPEASLYSLIDFIDEAERGFLQDKSVEPSFLQRLPFAEWAYRYYLPLAPLAVEQFDVTDHDVVVSSSYAVAKGVLTRADQLHVSYVHSPIRYAWDLYYDSLKGGGRLRGLRGLLARLVLHYMRLYDVSTAKRVDAFVANSHHVARRIWKTYRRPAHVIYPPVDVDRFTMTADKDDYFVAMSRLVPYKRMDLIVEAFTEMADRELVVIGDGPEYNALKKRAGPNVTLLGYQPDEAVAHYLEHARALVFAAEEDFGIVPVEAQACGTPVIAYGCGGVLETVQSGVTGVFFDEQSTDHLQEAVRTFERIEPTLNPEEIRGHAEQFAISVFQSAFSEFVRTAYDDFAKGECILGGDGVPDSPILSLQNSLI